MNRNSTYKFILTTVLSACYLVTLHAGIPEGMEEGLALQIDAELEKTVNGLVTEKQVCEESWISWPLPNSVPTSDRVARKVTEIIAKKSSEKFPATLKNEYEKLAQEKYGHFTPGDLVNFTLKDGTKINGYFREKGKTDILVDNRRIKFAELDDDQLAHFDEITRDVEVTEFVRGKLVALKNAKLEYEYKIRQEVLEKAYMVAGYFMVNGEWIAKRDYVAERLAEKRLQLRERLRPILKVKLYYDNGLVLFNDEWRTREEAEREQQLIDEAQAGVEKTDEVVNPDAEEVETEESADDAEEEPEDEDDSGGDGGLWD